MTCPAMCLLTEATLLNPTFYFLTSKKKFTGVYLNCIGYEHQEYYSEQERYDNISEFFLHKIPIHPTLPAIYIEDYSFGSHGKVFHIAENTGLLKYKLWDIGLKFNTVAPKAVKKFATGNGNADKAKMYEAFVSDTGIQLEQHYGVGSPVSDMVDAYYIAKYGLQLSQTTKGIGDEKNNSKGIRPKS